MKHDILVHIDRDPLYGMTRTEYEDKVKNLLAGRVVSAWFFGSYTSVDFNRHSDIDIIIVAHTAKPFTQRAMDFADLMDIVPTTDILVYTPDEFEKLTADPSPGFWRDVVRTMRRIV